MHFEVDPAQVEQEDEHALDSRYVEREKHVIPVQVEESELHSLDLQDRDALLMQEVELSAKPPTQDAH